MNPTTLLLAAAAGMTLGLLGAGGSMLTVPILLYAAHLPMHEAVPTSLLVVGVTAAAGAVSHARAGNVQWRAGLAFGLFGMAGAFLGGRTAGALPGELLQRLFAVVMVVAAVAMIRGRKDSPGHEGPVSVAALAVVGALVGGLTGLVGAGGGFVIVPALILFGRLEPKAAVGTSLVVIALQAAAGFAGHLGESTTDLRLALAVAAAAVVGSQIGTRLNAHVPARELRRAFGVLVIGLAGWMVAAPVLARWRAPPPSRPGPATAVSSQLSTGSYGPHTRRSRWVGWTR